MIFDFSNITVYIKRKIFFLFLLLCLPVASQSTNTLNQDSIPEIEAVSTPKKNLYKRTINLIVKALEQDSLYVYPHRYNMTIMPQYTYGFDYYRFATDNKEQSISITPSSNNKIGIYVGWKCFFAGYSFTLNNIQPETDLEISFFASRGGVELYYRKRSDGFKIGNLKGFKENDIALTNYNREFDGLTTSQIGANLLYVFNYRKFSFPAAYSQTTNQRISAGSLILGISYNEQLFSFDHTRIDPKIESLMLHDLKFNNINYINLNINFGYSYNWVFAKNFLTNISVSPAVGYKNTSLKSSINNSKEFFSSINIDFISRMALVYNNGKYYAGASLVRHTYSYTKSPLSILNGFGYIKVYAGFNFWHKK